MRHDPESMLTIVRTILAAERNALADGDFDALARSNERKQAVIALLESEEVVDSGELARLKREALRNQALVDGALSGLKRLMDRLHALNEVQTKLETYDEKGQVGTLKNRRHSIERHL